MLAHWALDPTVTYLNHGTVGAAPRVVLKAQSVLREEIESQPAQFLKDWLLFERRIEVQVLALGDGLWVRLSAQAYNDDEDVERLAEAVEERLGSGPPRR